MHRNGNGSEKRSGEKEVKGKGGESGANMAFLPKGKH